MVPMLGLNLGSGLWPTDLPGWINVDLPWHGVKSPHVYGNGFALPFKKGVFDRIYIGHVCEHIDWDDLPILGKEISRVAEYGAQIMVVGPDYERAKAQNEPPSILNAISDLNTGPGGHKWVATEALTIEACLSMGFVNPRALPITEVVPPAWPNPAPHALWQCAVEVSNP